MLSLWRLAKAFVRFLRRLPRDAAVALGAEGRGQPARPARFWQALAIVMPVSLLGFWLVPQLTLVMSTSIDAVLVRPDPGPISKGNYVQFQLAHALAGSDPVSVTKLALCMPGERLTMIEKPSSAAPAEWDGWYFCDGVLMNISKPFALGGMHLPHLQRSGVIPEGLVFVGSASPDGFDSRYFGPVPIAALQRMQRVW